MAGSSDTYGVCGYSPDARHDGDDDVFFDSEWSRIKRDTKDGNIRDVTGPQLAHGERQKEGDDLDFAQGTVIQHKENDRETKEREDKPG